jgi:Cft2 family RNA processing exonuclease
MGEIDFTNIIIDDFRKGKLNPFNRYLYILTHIHSDHLKGLSNSWDYGIIYCSQITANLILNKFPNLKHSIKVLPL